MSTPEPAQQDAVVPLNPLPEPRRAQLAERFPVGAHLAVTSGLPVLGGTVEQHTDAGIWLTRPTGRTFIAWQVLNTARV